MPFFVQRTPTTPVNLHRFSQVNNFSQCEVTQKVSILCQWHIHVTRISYGEWQGHAKIAFMRLVNISLPQSKFYVIRIANPSQHWHTHLDGCCPLDICRSMFTISYSVAFHSSFPQALTSRLLTWIRWMAFVFWMPKSITYCIAPEIRMTLLSPQSAFPLSPSSQLAVWRLCDEKAIFVCKTTAAWRTIDAKMLMCLIFTEQRTQEYFCRRYTIQRDVLIHENSASLLYICAGKREWMNKEKYEIAFVCTTK